MIGNLVSYPVPKQTYGPYRFLMRVKFIVDPPGEEVMVYGEFEIGSMVSAPLKDVLPATKAESLHWREYGCYRNAWRARG